LEIVAPRELVRAAVDSMASQAESKGIKLAADVPGDLPPVRADRAQITRVLVNLLSNSVRHTGEGGRITVRVNRLESAVRFEVQDTGTGIPAEYLPRIFERFVQVPGATGGGAGMGLSIAQTIVKAHGGETFAESELGKGSTFAFTLPLS